MTENQFSNYLIYVLTILITLFYYTSVLSQTNTVLDTLSDNQLYTHNQKQYVKSTKMPFEAIAIIFLIFGIAFPLISFGFSFLGTTALTFTFTAIS